MWIWIAIIVSAIIADQVTKQLVINFLDRNESFDVIPGVFRFTYVENRGAAFGMLDDHRWVFMIVSTVAIIGLTVYLLKFCPQKPFLKTGMALVIGGGIGNMIDRVALGYVVDFLDFCAFPDIWMWIFNVADVCVCVGAGMIALYLVIDIINETKMEKARKNATVTEKTETEEEKDADA